VDIPRLGLSYERKKEKEKKRAKERENYSIMQLTLNWAMEFQNPGNKHVIAILKCKKCAKMLIINSSASE